MEEHGYVAVLLFVAHDISNVVGGLAVCSSHFVSYFSLLLPIAFHFHFLFHFFSFPFLSFLFISFRFHSHLISFRSIPLAIYVHVKWLSQKSCSG